MKPKGIGIDIVEIRRFRRFRAGSADNFVVKNFTEEERRYCFSYKNPAAHMAGTFAAKEAVYKALKNFSGSFSAIEIRRDKNGRPTVWIGGKEEKSFFVSISHTDKIAMAIALNQ